MRSPGKYFRRGGRSVCIGIPFLLNPINPGTCRPGFFLLFLFFFIPIFTLLFRYKTLIPAEIITIASIIINAIAAAVIVDNSAMPAYFNTFLIFVYLLFKNILLNVIDFIMNDSISTSFAIGLYD